MLRDDFVDQGGWAVGEEVYLVGDLAVFIDEPERANIYVRHIFRPRPEPGATAEDGPIAHRAVAKEVHVVPEFVLEPLDFRVFRSILEKLVPSRPAAKTPNAVLRTIACCP